MLWSIVSNALLLAQVHEPEASSVAQEVTPGEVLTMLVISAVLTPAALWLLHRINAPEQWNVAKAPMRPNSIGVAHIVALFVGWQLAGAIIAIASASLGETPSLMFANLAGQILVFTAAVWLAHKAFARGAQSGMGLDISNAKGDITRGFLMFFAVIGPVILILTITRWILPDLPEHEMLTQIRIQPVVWKVVIAFSAIIGAPLAEEVLFRGLLQSCLRKYMDVWPAILVSSVIFAVIHFSVPDSVLPLILLSLGLGWLYESTGRLVAPILLHALFNTMSILAALQS